MQLFITNRLAESVPNFTRSAQSVSARYRFPGDMAG